MNLPSAKYELKLSDWLKGLLVAVGTTILPALIALFNTGAFPNRSQLMAILIGGVSAGLTYVAKNFFTDTNAVAVKTINEAEKEQIKNQNNL